MKTETSWGKGIAVLTVALFLATPSESSRPKGAEPPSIIDRWSVSMVPPNPEVKNHTLEFASNSICTEKYTSPQATGPADAPPEFVDTDAVVTYRYRFLGKKRYRLYQMRAVYGGRVSPQVPVWKVLHVDISGVKAAVYVVSRQGDEFMKKMGLDVGVSRRARWNKGAINVNRERQSWTRAS